MAEREQHDAIVIGPGQSGAPLAVALARAGREVAVVETAPAAAGECLPANALRASARVAHLARRSVEFGIRTGAVSVDFQRVRQRVRAVCQRLRDRRSQALQESPGLRLLRGEAQFLDRQTVRVLCTEGERLLSAPQIFVDTGASEAPVPLPGLARVRHFDPAGLLEVDSLPEHLLVLGGTASGVELAQAFRRLGSRVCVIEPSPQLLPGEDRDVAAAVAEVLRQEGIAVFLESRAARVREAPGGGLLLRMCFPGGERTLAGTHLLLATGRRPNTAGLALDSAGIELDDQGYVPVNAALQSSVAGIYALGGLKGGQWRERPSFPHPCQDDYALLRTKLLGNGHTSASERVDIPCYTVLTDPPLGRLGLTECEALGRGLDVKVAKIPVMRVARAMEAGETCGFAKIVVEASTRRILGAALLSVEGGVLLATLHVAMLGKIPYTVLRDCTVASPTPAQLLGSLLAALDDAEREGALPDRAELAYDRGGAEQRPPPERLHRHKEHQQ